MKRSLWRRVGVKLAVVGGMGVLFQLGNPGCTSFFANAGLSSMDFFFLFNCNDGALGGLIQFCRPINFTSFVGQGDANTGANQGAQPFLADCP